VYSSPVRRKRQRCPGLYRKILREKENSIMEISKESLENLLERTGLNGITEVLLPHLRKMERRYKEQMNPPKYMSEFCGRLSFIKMVED
jgi:hypothetical protein